MDRRGGGGGERSWTMEISVTRFVVCVSCATYFFNRFFLWCKSHKVLLADTPNETKKTGVNVVKLFLADIAYGKKKPLFLQKGKKGVPKHKNHPTTAIAAKGGEACSPHEHFGYLRHA